MTPPLLPRTTDTFQVFSWLLGSIKLCWSFQSFLKSCPLSFKTCSLFSLNSVALPPWPALWATFPLPVPWIVMFPDFYPGPSPLLPVYVLFLGYLLHFYDLNYHLMLMASKSIHSALFYHIWLPSKHSPGGAAGSSYSTWPPVESITILAPVLPVMFSVHQYPNGPNQNLGSCSTSLFSQYLFNSVPSMSLRSLFYLLFSLTSGHHQG